MLLLLCCTLTCTAELVGHGGTLVVILSCCLFPADLRKVARLKAKGNHNWGAPSPTSQAVALAHRFELPSFSTSARNELDGVTTAAGSHNQHENGWKINWRASGSNLLDTLENTS